MAKLKKTRFKSVYQTASGKYIYQTVINKKSIKSKTYDSSREAYNELLLLKSGGKTEITDRTGTTIKNIVDGYNEHLKLTAKITTYKNYYNRFILISKIVDFSLNIKSLADEKVINHFIKTITEKYNTINTINALISAYQKLSERAYYLGKLSQVEYGFIKLNVKVKNFVDKKTREKKFYTLEEYNHFISFAPNENVKLIFDILFFCGLRIGELLGLRANRIKLDTQEIIIDNQMTAYNVNKAPKSKNSIRTIKVKKEVFNELVNYLKVNNLTDEDYLFQVSRKAIDNFSRSISQEANIEHLNLHGFRHSCVSLLFETYRINNIAVNFKMIASYVGDNVNMITDIYSHLYTGNTESIIDLI